MSDKIGSCRVEAVVSIDPKGQIVLPKNLREKAGLRPDDKLAVMACEEKGEICCIIMVKADKLGASIKSYLGPVLTGILK
jgi:antitoxin PrlF